MAKKLEYSKSTAKHIKQLSCEPQATQVNLLRHQRTELWPSKLQRKERKVFRSKQTNHKYWQDDREPQVQKKFKHADTSQEDRCTRCGDTPHIEGFRCPTSIPQCKYCHKFGHFSHLCFKKKQESEYKRSSRKPKTHQIMVGRYSTERSLSEQILAWDQAKKTHSVYRWKANRCMPRKSVLNHNT